MAASRRGSGRTRTQMLSTVTCYPLPAGTGAHTDWFKTHVPDQTRERPHFIQSLADLCRPTLARSYTCRLGLIFIPMGGPRPMLTRGKGAEHASHRMRLSPGCSAY